MAFPASAAIPGTIHDRGLSQFPQSGFSVGPALAPLPQVCNTMVKALARAFRRRKMLDEGVHATIEDLGKAKRLAPSYVSGILRLTLLAPEIVEAILDGRQHARLQLDDLLDWFPLEWEWQREAFVA